MFHLRVLFRTLAPMLVLGLLLAGCIMPATAPSLSTPTPAPTPPPTEEPPPPTEDRNAVWQAQDYKVMSASHGSFAGRTRSRISLVAPDAVTPEQRLATLMEEALRAYRQGEIEDTAFLTLWPSELDHPGWQLARITFASDRCGWTGEECQGSHWSDVFANSAVFTEEQLRIDAFQNKVHERFHEPFLALNEEGQPLSQAGWACYDPIVDIPAEGGCYTNFGTLYREGMNRTTCRQFDLPWLWPDEEWGVLDTACAQDRMDRYTASQLDLDLATVAGNFDAMLMLSWGSDTKVIGEIPQALEEQQDFQRR